MVMRIKSGGAFRDISIPRVKSGGAFRDITVARVKQGGAWRDVTFGMRWTLTTDSYVSNQIRVAGYTQGYPHIGAYRELGSIDPSSDRDLDVRGMELSGVVSLFGNGFQHYDFYFNTLYSQSSSIRADLNANYRWRIESVNTSWAIEKDFSIGAAVWTSEGSSGATLYRYPPPTEQFQQLHTDTQYLFKVIRK